jgi:outer membrane protein OmpA-like peptidoglycan-associated protein
MKTIIIFFGFIAGFINFSIAQEKSKKEIEGDKFLFTYSYLKAIDLYTESKPLTLDGHRNLAKSYLKTDQFIKAEKIDSLIANHSAFLPEDYYNYSMVLRRNGETEKANIWMNKFQVLKPNDLRAQSFLNNESKLMKYEKNNPYNEVKLMTFNTSDEDFGTAFYADKIVFSSTRANPKFVKRKYNLNGKPFLDLYISDVKDGELVKPKIFDKKLSGIMHDGPASFSNQNTFMALTRNVKPQEKDKASKKVVELQIFFSSLVNKKWSKPIPFFLNSLNYSVGHPCLTPDGETMYFTSDMPGGMGGSDIYKISKDKNGIWGTATNLGSSVNTEGDEMFPYYIEKNDILFFTSNGHLGLGGLDVFSIRFNNGKASQAINMGSPINSRFDDFAFILGENLDNGYFSSNRTGGAGDDDIYRIAISNNEFFGKKIIGVAKDINNTILPNTFVSLQNSKGEFLDSITTKEDGSYSFLAEANQNYKLTGFKIDFISRDTSFYTDSKEYIQQVDLILLTKEEVILKQIEVGIDLGKVLSFSPIYFDFDRYNIRENETAELDQIIQLMNKNQNLTIEIKAYTDCRQSDEYNQILSDKRAIATIEYISKKITKPERIYGKGYGEKFPIIQCKCYANEGVICSEIDHQKNRRTEFIVIKK